MTQKKRDDARWPIQTMSRCAVHTNVESGSAMRATQHLLPPSGHPVGQNIRLHSNRRKHHLHMQSLKRGCEGSETVWKILGIRLYSDWSDFPSKPASLESVGFPKDLKAFATLNCNILGVWPIGSLKNVFILLGSCRACDLKPLMQYQAAFTSKASINFLASYCSAPACMSIALRTSSWTPRHRILERAWCVGFIIVNEFCRKEPWSDMIFSGLSGPWFLIKCVPIPSNSNS